MRPSNPVSLSPTAFGALFLVLSPAGNSASQVIEFDDADRALPSSFQTTGVAEFSAYSPEPDRPSPLSTGTPDASLHVIGGASAHRSLAAVAAARHGLPVGLFLALIDQESRWNPNALSPKGAIGLAQLMPATARALGVDPHDPAQNLEGGARYLAAQARRFGSWELALAAYNAGPRRVEAYGGVPPFRETRLYVTAILRNWRPS